MRTAGILIATVLLLFGGFFLFYQPVSESPDSVNRTGVTPMKTEGNQIVQGPVLDLDVSRLPDEGLVDQEGREFRFEDLKGRPVLISFIYTSCPGPKMCPLLTEKMVRIQEKVNRNDDVSARFVSVTFDPQTDTPETLKHYGESKNVNFENWSFVTGPAEIIDQVTKQFQITAKSNPEKEDVMIHNMRTYVLSNELTVKYAWRQSDWSVERVFEKLKTLQ